MIFFELRKTVSDVLSDSEIYALCVFFCVNTTHKLCVFVCVCFGVFKKTRDRPVVPHKIFWWEWEPTWVGVFKICGMWEPTWVGVSRLCGMWGGNPPWVCGNLVGLFGKN